jgi:type IX secretion system PorP/SprF family membrane protein
MYDMSPLNLNPALTGSYVGDYRFNANHRLQWRSVTVPYATFAFSGDARHWKGNEKFSFGLQVNQDRAGDSRFNTFQCNVSGLYHHRFTNATKHAINLALQSGFTNRNLQYDDLRFDVQYDGFQYNANLGNQESFMRESRNYVNLNAGATYVYTLSDHQKLEIGLGFFNLTRPRQSFFNDDDILLDVRTNVHATYRWQLNEKWILSPMTFAYFQGTYKSLNMGGIGEYVLLDFAGSYRSVWGGLFYRNRDAAFVCGGIRYDQWKFGLSYDINVSSLVPASNYRGSFEIAVQYIINKTPYQRIFHRVCPDYI